MAIKYQIPIISSFIIRETPYHHCVITENIEYNPNSPDVIADILKVFNSRLENLITKHPEQWIWWHRRWRRQPGIDYVKHHELLPSTKNYLSWLNEQTQNKN